MVGSLKYCLAVAEEKLKISKQNMNETKGQWIEMLIVQTEADTWDG